MQKFFRLTVLLYILTSTVLSSRIYLKYLFQNTEHGWREVMVDLDEEDGYCTFDFIFNTHALKLFSEKLSESLTGIEPVTF